MANSIISAERLYGRKPSTYTTLIDKTGNGSSTTYTDATTTVRGFYRIICMNNASVSINDVAIVSTDSGQRVDTIIPFESGVVLHAVVASSSSSRVVVRLLNGM